MKPVCFSIFTCFLILTVIACSPAAEEKTEEDTRDIYISSGELKLLFKNQKAEGTLVIYDLTADRYFIHNEERAMTGYIPASTFKIANSLIALETGVIQNQSEIIPWDGIDRGPKAWNKDHNLQSAFKASAVWFYQDLARKTGKGRMQYWIRKAGYGNQESGSKIDQFWLNGDLRVSALEQISFLVSLHTRDMEFSRRNIEIVKSIMLEEETSRYILRSKTGLATLPDPDIGWYVGYVEKGENAYFFALNLDIQKESDLSLRKTLVRKALKLAGIT